MRVVTWTDRAVAAYAWTLVALRVPVLAAWIVAAVLAWIWLPAPGGSSESPLQDVVPRQSAALAAQERALRLFGSTASTDTLVVQRNADGLGLSAAEGLARGAVDVARRRQPRDLAGVRGAVPLVNVPVPGVRWREQGTTAVTFLFLAPELNLLERAATAKGFVERYGRAAPGTSVAVTGAGPARLAQYEEIESRLPWVEAATVAVILLVVALYFRSLGAPLVTLFTAALAYVVAVRVLAWSSERAGVIVPREIEPILVVLLLGVVTDYTLFFMSEGQRRLALGQSRLEAARGATKRIVPIVLAAGTLVAGGALALMAGELEFFRVFGPGLAVTAIVVTIVCVTLVPALLGLFGPRLFRRTMTSEEPRRRRRASPLRNADAPGREGGIRRRLRLRTAGLLGAHRASRRLAREQDRAVLPLLGVRLLTTRPAALVLAAACIVALVLAAGAARSSDLAVSYLGSLPEDSEPRRAADDAARGFVPGIVSPTDVVLEQRGIGDRLPALVRLQALVARERGVELALGPREQAAIRSARFAVADGGGAARLVVVLREDATGARGIADFQSLRDRMPALMREAGLPPGVRASYSGDAALATEVVEAIEADVGRIAVAALLITFVLLALFLRALVAPLLLLFASALAVVASFGLTTLALPATVGGSDYIYYVPLVAIVLLVALGSDYNVFIAARIREEASRRRTREAVAVAAPAASRAITAAGFTLAGTFALLALVPLRPFTELALLMAIGVLVDALLVRPLLIPSLVALTGRRAWWPGRPTRAPATKAFVRRVAQRTGRSRRDARRIADATFCTLGERLNRSQARELAPHLPPGLAAAMGQDAGAGEPFTSEEFVRRVAERTGTATDVAGADVRAVFATLAEAVPATELDYVRAALSADYRPLVGERAAAREELPLEAAAG